VSAGGAAVVETRRAYQHCRQIWDLAGAKPAGIGGDEALHDTLVGPVAGSTSKGAWYRGWRLVSLDGSTLDIANEPDNDAAFGRPGAGQGDAAFHKFALSRWSRTARMSCLAARCLAAGPANSC
jgi:hypothetical protein